VTAATLKPSLSATTGSGATDRHLSERQVRDIAAQALSALDLAGKRVLLIVPDSTRTAPVGLLFRVLHDLLGDSTRALDVLIALGTHPPMDDEAINRRLEITAEERAGKYGRVRVLNHAWDDPAALAHVGTIPADEIDALSGGLFALDVAVTINRVVFDYGYERPDGAVRRRVAGHADQGERGRPRLHPDRPERPRGPPHRQAGNEGGRGRLTRWPSTRVPVAEPRSSRSNPPGIRSCRRGSRRRLSSAGASGCRLAHLHKHQIVDITARGSPPGGAGLRGRRVEGTGGNA
jgi:hypothetical protein